MLKRKVWYMWYGKWWMIQCCFDGWISFGIHLDFKRRLTGKDRIRYGPYIDIHFLNFIFSFGINPRYSTAYPYTNGRGGNY